MDIKSSPAKIILRNKEIVYATNYFNIKHQIENQQEFIVFTKYGTDCSQMIRREDISSVIELSTNETLPISVPSCWSNDTMNSTNTPDVDTYEVTIKYT